MESDELDEESKHQPWLGIETVAAFEFCPNAGLIAYLRENALEDRDTNRIPNLGYTPSFEFAILIERVANLKLNIARLTLFGALLFFSLAVLVRNSQLVLASIFLVGALPVIYQLIREFEEYFQVLKQIREYDATIPRPLPDIGTEIVPIHWWELVKSGWSPILPQNYFDRENAFRGRPWRLLEDEESGKKIPVVWDREIVERRFLSIPRYKMQLVLSAMLIEHHEGGQVDWGLLLDPKTLEAQAIPINATDKENAISHLRFSQKRIRELKGQRTFQKPPGYACQFCKMAYPSSSTKPTKIGEEIVQPYFYGLLGVLDTDSDIYDSDDSTDDESDGFEVSLADDYGDTQELSDFRDWLLNARTHAASRHSECGDIFRKPRPHNYWKVKLADKLEQYRRWAERHAEY